LKTSPKLPLAAVEGVKASCRLVSTVARLPGMQPPLLLWLLQGLIGDLSGEGKQGVI